MSVHEGLAFFLSLSKQIIKILTKTSILVCKKEI